MPDFLVERIQDTYPAVAEGAVGAVRGNNRGEIIVPDWHTQLIADGSSYVVSNVARETALAVGGTSFSDTATAFLLDVPAGTTIFPTEIIMRQGGTVAGAIITVLITVDTGLRFSTGGAQQTPRNLRINATPPKTSSCSFYTGATASANVTDTTVWAGRLIQDLDALVGGHVELSNRKQVMPVLEGPASLVVYAFAGSTQPSWFFSIKFAEFASASAV